MNIIYSKNETSFFEKPNKKQISLIQKQGFQATKSPIEGLKSHIEDGGSFLLPTFLNDITPSSDDFISQNTFAVDIDGGMYLAEAESLLQEFDITYNFGYYTFSHTDIAKPRFRLLFVMDGEVRSKELAVIINKAFLRIFEK